jgi:predicted regulator of Ras-like GTPase activity (Roadblock/LC7/MglB family)
MALVGDLKDISVATLVQLNCVEKNTGQLGVETPKGAATVYFDRGEIIEAMYAGTTGEEALYRILSLTEGEFRVTGVTDLPGRTITTSWQSLLLEGMRVMDETEKGKTKIAESIGKDLNNTPEVESYVIASKRGDVLATNRDENAEKVAAAAALLSWKGQKVSSDLGLGEMDFAQQVHRKKLTFFMDCGDLVAAITMKKSVVLEPVYALVDDVRKKLKYFEMVQAQQGPEATS